MKYFVLALVLCSGFLFQNGLSGGLDSQEQLLDGKRINLDDEANYQDNHVIEAPFPNNAACKCKNGECVYEGGEEICKCPPGFGNYTSTRCEDCDCGSVVDCIWTRDYGGKVCFCKPGYMNTEGKCVACECGLDSNCIWDSDEKVCFCPPGYGYLMGKCEDCECGLDSNCTWESTWTAYIKKCHCKPGYTDIRGKCVEECGLVDGDCASPLQCLVLGNGAKKVCVSCDCSEYQECFINEEGLSGCRCPEGKIETKGEDDKKCLKKCNLEGDCDGPLKCLELNDGTQKVCVECDCGAYGICNFENGQKKCKCVPLTIEFEGKCVECDCGVHGLCEFEFGQKKCFCAPSYIVVNGRCQECECGEATDSCYLDLSDKKRCTCLRGYEENNGYCAECDCGPDGSCSYVSGIRKCVCNLYYSERNGTCEYCSCGENSNFCYFDLNLDKRCNCPSGYAEKDGRCEECDCGSYGSCIFENGTKRCECNSFTVEKNGLCIIIATTTDVPFTETSTILTSTTQDFGTTSESTTDSTIRSTIVSSTVQECDCGPRGRCTFENGYKKCICDPFTTEKDGKCVDCYCGENSKSCRFSWNGDKVCNCTSGYSQVYGFCYDCNCGLNARSCFYRKDGAKVCNCNFGYTQRNGHCSDICSEGTCVHGTCEIVENGFKCRCNEGFTGQRCEEKIPIKPNKQDFWMVMILSVTFAIFILLSGMFCFWTRILNKMSKK